MISNISAVNRQSMFKPVAQAATRPQRNIAFKSYEGTGTYEEFETKDNSTRNTVITVAAGLAVLVGAAFGIKHGVIKGSTKKGAENFIENGFLRGVRHVTDIITKPFEAIGGLFSKKKDAAEEAAGEAPKKVQLLLEDKSQTTITPKDIKDLDAARRARLDKIETAIKTPGTTDKGSKSIPVLAKEAFSKIKGQVTLRNKKTGDMISVPAKDVDKYIKPTKTKKVVKKTRTKKTTAKKKNEVATKPVTKKNVRKTKPKTKTNKTVKK